jgi:hypothetical protein
VVIVAGGFGSPARIKMTTRSALLIVFILVNLTASAQAVFDCNGIRQRIKDTRELIDSLRHREDYSELYAEKIDTLNDNLVGYLRELSVDDHFQNCDVNQNYNFAFLLSSDKNFCITSWDTRQGGTMIDYTSTVIYKTPQKTDIKTLQYGEGDHKDNTKILFDTLLTIHNKKGQPIYLAYGFGQGSSLIPYRVLKAFIITDGLVEEFSLFPDKTSELWIQYDLKNFRPEDDILEILFKDGGKRLKIPVVDGESRPTHKYYNLVFNGLTYQRK